MNEDLSTEELEALDQALAQEKEGKSNRGRKVVVEARDVRGCLRYRSSFIYFAWILLLVTAVLAVVRELATTTSFENPVEVYLVLIGLSLLFFLRAKSGPRILDFKLDDVEISSLVGGTNALSEFRYARAYRHTGPYTSGASVPTVILLYERAGFHLLPKLLAFFVPRSSRGRTVLFLSGWRTEEREFVSGIALEDAVKKMLRKNGFVVKERGRWSAPTLSWEAERT